MVQGGDGLLMRIKQDPREKEGDKPLWGRGSISSPEDVISRDDASDAVRRAIKVYGLCKRFMTKIENGE